MVLQVKANMSSKRETRTKDGQTHAGEMQRRHIWNCLRSHSRHKKMGKLQTCIMTPIDKHYERIRLCLKTTSNKRRKRQWRFKDRKVKQRQEEIENWFTETMKYKMKPRDEDIHDFKRDRQQDISWRHTTKIQKQRSRRKDTQKIEEQENNE